MKSKLIHTLPLISKAEQSANLEIAGGDVDCLRKLAPFG